MSIVGSYSSTRTLLVCAAIVAILGASSVALKSGLDEIGLIRSGPRRELAAEELRSERGLVSLFGCVRHDLAVVVTRGGLVRRLGDGNAEGSDEDRVFTPLAGRNDCSEERIPSRFYAVVENDDSLGDTLRHAYQQKVAPPPVVAMVSGAIGYGSGHPGLWQAARAFYRADRQLELGDLPLVVKGKQPGVLSVAATTAAAGAHGFLFAALMGWWWWRRRRRAAAELHEDEVEEQFFATDTLDS